MHATLLTLAALSMGFSGETAKQVNPLLGAWKVQLSKEVTDAALKLGLPVPEAEFNFNPDSTFSYSSTQGGVKNSWTGKYELHDHDFVLNCSASNWPADALTGHVDDASFTFNGLKYVHPCSIVGLWTVHNLNGTEDKSIKMTFKKDGTFSFKCSDASSKGTYTVLGGLIFLKWTEVDGEKVQFDMHKTLALSDDASSFMIDTYRYARS